MLKTFGIVTITFIMFEAVNMTLAIEYYFSLIDFSIFSIPTFISPKQNMLNVLVFSLLLLVVDWIQRNKAHFLEIQDFSLKHRWSIYFVITFLIVTFSNFGAD